MKDGQKTQKDGDEKRGKNVTAIPNTMSQYQNTDGEWCDAWGMISNDSGGSE